MRTRIYWTMSLVLALATGWHANNGVRYVQGVFAKAALCDSMNCAKIQDAADRMVELELPAVKRSTK